MDNQQKSETDAFTEWLYSDIVKDHFTNPRNVVFGDDAEVLKEANGVGVVGSPVCGDMMKVYIVVDAKADRIVGFKWKTFGCGGCRSARSTAPCWATRRCGRRYATTW
jgi:NifU-like protein involved in Fe-S cluster formation